MFWHGLSGSRHILPGHEQPTEQPGTQPGPLRPRRAAVGPGGWLDDDCGLRRRGSARQRRQRRRRRHRGPVPRGLAILVTPDSEALRARGCRGARRRALPPARSCIKDYTNRLAGRLAAAALELRSLPARRRR